MCHERWGVATRRAALALLFGLYLSAAGPGCSPADPTSNGPAGVPDRLEKMRALRGTGDPRRRGKPSSIPGAGIPGRGGPAPSSGVDRSAAPRRHHGTLRRPPTSS
jgi:hypothetical protein